MFHFKKLWGPINKDILKEIGATPTPSVFKDEGDNGQQWWSGMLEHGDVTHIATHAPNSNDFGHGSGCENNGPDDCSPSTSPQDFKEGVLGSLLSGSGIQKV